MSHIQLTRIIPITDQILLIVFKDTELEKHDVKFILHELDGIRPRSDPDHFRAFLRENEQIISEWECKIGGIAPEPDKDAIEVTITMPADELTEIETACADMNITVQQLALAVIRFCVDPDGGEALQEWYEYMEAERPTCPKCNQELKHRIAIDVDGSNSKNTYTCNNCRVSWSINNETEQQNR